MSRPHFSFAQASFLEPFQQAITEVGFRDGMILALRHEGKITRLELSTAVSDKQLATARFVNGRNLTVEQIALYLLQRLNHSLRDWIYKFGRFQFDIADMKVVGITITIGFKPHEEGQIVRFNTNGDAAVIEGIADAAGWVGSAPATHLPPPKG